MNASKNVLEGNDNQQLADRLEIIYYTDPLCCWSWGMEPQWRKLLYNYKDQINYRICMTGLLPGWKNYNDSINSVTKPIQMGPVWMHAEQVTGMPMRKNMWISHPPQSSYPACVAFKCAQLQSPRAGIIYLRLLREAIMLRGENIGRQSVLIRLAQDLSILLPDFDPVIFKQDLINDAGLTPFKKDLEEVHYHRINRFPSLVIRNQEHKAVLIAGYKPYSILSSTVVLLGAFPMQEKAINPEEYNRYWGAITDRELREIESI